MNVLCAICQDVMGPSSDMFITPCGHVFHFPCLIQWLEKVQNCPQCRQKVIRDKITRIYFNFSNAEEVKEDSFTLQQKVDSLSFQIKLKETEYNTSRRENMTLKKQNSGLREEVKKTESEIAQKNSVIHALKEQSLYFKEKSENYDKIVKQNAELQNKLATYEDVKLLVCSTSDEADKMLSRTTDPSTLSTYVAIMKRELATSLSRRKELRQTVKRLQQDLQTIKMKRNSFTEDYIKRIEQLEEEITLCKSENEVLQKRLAKLEGASKKSNNGAQEVAHSSCENISRKRETDLAFDVDSVSPIKIMRTIDKLKLSLSPKLTDDSDIVLVSPPVKKTKENEENSPYLPTKSKSLLALKVRASQKSGRTISMGAKPMLSIKKSDTALRKTREEDSTITFDGFGGHSKMETFPKTSPRKLKRPGSETAKNKKIKLDLVGNKQLDDFIINLT